MNGLRTGHIGRGDDRMTDPGCSTRRTPNAGGAAKHRCGRGTKRRCVRARPRSRCNSKCCLPDPHAAMPLLQLKEGRSGSGRPGGQLRAMKSSVGCTATGRRPVHRTWWRHANHLHCTRKAVSRCGGCAKAPTGKHGPPVVHARGTEHPRRLHRRGHCFAAHLQWHPRRRDGAVGQAWTTIPSLACKSPAEQQGRRVPVAPGSVAHVWPSGVRRRSASHSGVARIAWVIPRGLPVCLPASGDGGRH